MTTAPTPSPMKPPATPPRIVKPEPYCGTCVRAVADRAARQIKVA